MMKVVGYNKIADFCMTDNELYLDPYRSSTLRFCLSSTDLFKRKSQLWIGGYCLFYINNEGLYKYLGVGNANVGEIMIDVSLKDNKLKIIGVDLL